MRGKIICQALIHFNSYPVFHILADNIYVFNEIVSVDYAPRKVAEIKDIKTAVKFVHAIISQRAAKVHIVDTAPEHGQDNLFINVNISSRLFFTSGTLQDLKIFQKRRYLLLDDGYVRGPVSFIFQNIGKFLAFILYGVDDKRRHGQSAKPLARQPITIVDPLRLNIFALRRIIVGLYDIIKSISEICLQKPSVPAIAQFVFHKDISLLYGKLFEEFLHFLVKKLSVDLIDYVQASVRENLPAFPHILQTLEFQGDIPRHIGELPAEFLKQVPFAHAGLFLSLHGRFVLADRRAGRPPPQNHAAHRPSSHQRAGGTLFMKCYFPSDIRTHVPGTDVHPVMSRAVNSRRFRDDFHFLAIGRLQVKDIFSMKILVIGAVHEITQIKQKPENSPYLCSRLPQ